ncbi:Alpha/Beta hydrolase protein [Aspergillus unguis]
MPLAYDPEFYKTAAPGLQALAAAPKATTPHDVPAVRAHLEAMIEPAAAAAPALPEIEESVFQVPSYDGYLVSVHKVALKPTNPYTIPEAGPAIVHAHGGGTIYGSAGKWTRIHHPMVKATGVPIYTVEYRLAPENPFPAGVEDVYAVLKWIHEQGERIGVDSARLAVAGESAGGNLAAAVAIMARDRGLSPSVKKQLLYYPALDDRNVVPDEELEGFVAPWNYVHSVTAWGAYLGKENVGKDDVSPYASPARVKNFEGLPAAYIDVGGLDIFRDECAAYAKGLREAGVAVEFHLYEGLTHVFEIFGFGTEPVMRALVNRLAAVQGI